MKRLLLLLFLMFLIMSGCATAPWVQVESPYRAASLGFSVDLPQGWMRLNKEDFLLVTRDGAMLQHIAIDRVSVDKPFEFTKKKLKKGMLPEEAAEAALDNMSSNPDVLNFKIEEKAPATTSGCPGFRVTYTYKNKSGLRLKTVCYGFLKGEWYYTIRYTGVQRYYFDKDIGTFDKVFNSFRLI